MKILCKLNSSTKRYRLVYKHIYLQEIIAQYYEMSCKTKRKITQVMLITYKLSKAYYFILVLYLFAQYDTYLCQKTYKTRLDQQKQRSAKKNSVKIFKINLFTEPNVNRNVCCATALVYYGSVSSVGHVMLTPKLMALGRW